MRRTSVVNIYRMSKYCITNLCDYIIWVLLAAVYLYIVYSSLYMHIPHCVPSSRIIRMCVSCRFLAGCLTILAYCATKGIRSFSGIEAEAKAELASIAAAGRELATALHLTSAAKSGSPNGYASLSAKEEPSSEHPDAVGSSSGHAGSDADAANSRGEVRRRRLRDSSSSSNTGDRSGVSADLRVASSPQAIADSDRLLLSPSGSVRSRARAPPAAASSRSSSSSSGADATTAVRLNGSHAAAAATSTRDTAATAASSAAAAANGAAAGGRGRPPSPSSSSSLMFSAAVAGGSNGGRSASKRRVLLKMR